MKDDLNWQDVKLFLSVVRHKGLIGASFETGLSSPTLGRRMHALEDQLNNKLFTRDNKGYSLTKYGQEFYHHALKIERAALSVNDWKQGFSGRYKVLISAGAYTFHHLTQHIHHLWNMKDSYRLELIVATERLNIAQGKIDIGIRAGQPSEPWLAGRKAGKVDFAIYRNKDAMVDIPWITTPYDGAKTAWSQWIHQYHHTNIALNVDDPMLMLDLVKQGIGKTILPCFIGDNEPNLIREKVIEELSHERWLVFHQDRRHHPAIRSLINKLSKILLTI